MALDDTLNDDTQDNNFVISNYGVDYTVDTVVRRLVSEAFFVPTFQRRFVWSQKHASRFIESLLMGLPVPGIFLYRQPETNRHLVVDGQQRLRTLQYFYEGLFVEKKFKLVGINKKWAGKTYKDLDPADQLKLDDSIIHATIFQQDDPKETTRSLHFVFERINSGGIRLSPQEIRNCIHEGDLLALIRDLNELPKWRALFGERGNARLKDQELILRFLAMMGRADKYARPMGVFLNEFAEDYRRASKEDLAAFAASFTDTIGLIADAIGPAAFRPQGALNAAVFEGVMIGLARRLQGKQARPAIPDVKEGYRSLMNSKQFLRACERATADAETVRERHKLATEAFAG